jgi:hypothetical protein
MVHWRILGLVDRLCVTHQVVARRGLLRLELALGGADGHLAVAYDALGPGSGHADRGAASGR